MIALAALLSDRQEVPLRHSPDETHAVPAAQVEQVAVTVTTLRRTTPGWHFDWNRRSVVEGDFETTVHSALAERLGPPALHQVLGRILTRRPGPAQAIEYDGAFSPRMHLMVLVHPQGCDGTEPGAHVDHVTLQGLSTHPRRRRERCRG